MPIKKSDDIANEGSKYGNQKATAKLENITDRFDDTTHNDNPYDDAIQYLKKKVDEVVDETNTQTTASGSYAQDIKNLTLASGSFSTRVTANDVKVTATVTSNVLSGITLTVTKKGALVITAGEGDAAKTYTLAPDE